MSCLLRWRSQILSSIVLMSFSVPVPVMTNHTLRFVFLIFERLCLICPCWVSSDSGKYFLTANSVSPGHVAKYLDLIALSQVDLVGKPAAAAACRYLTSASVLGRSYALTTHSCRTAFMSLPVCIALYQYFHSPHFDVVGISTDLFSCLATLS